MYLDISQVVLGDWPHRNPPIIFVRFGAKETRPRRALVWLQHISGPNMTFYHPIFQWEIGSAFEMKPELGKTVLLILCRIEVDS